MRSFQNPSKQLTSSRKQLNAVSHQPIMYHKKQKAMDAEQYVENVRHEILDELFNYYLSVYQLRLKVLKNIGSPVKNYIKA